MEAAWKLVGMENGLDILNPWKRFIRQTRKLWFCNLPSFSLYLVKAVSHNVLQKKITLVPEQ
jgi:hypothetical protein